MSRGVPSRLSVPTGRQPTDAATQVAEATARGLSGQLVGKRSRVIEGKFSGRDGCILNQRWIAGNWRTVSAVDPDGNLHLDTEHRAMGIGTGSALPTASAAYVGRVWHVPASSGVPATVYVCTANSGGGYEWVVLAQST